MRQNQKSTIDIFSSGYYIWPMFRRMSIFSQGTRLCCNVTAITSTCSAVVAWFNRKEHENPLSEFPRHPNVKYMQSGDFEDTPSCMLFSGRFGEDSAWFFVLAGHRIEEWMTNTEFVFEALISAWKSAEPFLNGPFTHRGLTKSRIYSSSGLYNYNFVS